MKTAVTQEANWETAHRVLVPAFGPLNIQNMFLPMKDILSQLVLKWARHGALNRISVTEDFTRLTLDTLALCAMGYRFNSLYTDQLHPFIGAMVRVLKHSGARANQPSLLRIFAPSDEVQWNKDIEYMRNFSLQLIQQRVETSSSSKDLLDAMVNGKDPKTGKTLSQNSIIDNMITFLVAGHETTSGALSFVFYYLLKHPECIKKARDEVDSVVGDQPVQHEHLSRLSYITAIHRESLRLQPTAPAFSFTPKSENGEFLAGEYFIQYGEAVHGMLHSVHRDESVFGKDSEIFKPERMMEEHFKELPANSWKPFGNGARGCIGPYIRYPAAVNIANICPGRPFAWQEMLLAVATLLKYFDFELDDPSYTLQLSETLTIKPKNLFIRAQLRKGWDLNSVETHMIGKLRQSTSSDVMVCELH